MKKRKRKAGRPAKGEAQDRNNFIGGAAMKLYYHETSGGAKYLTDRWTRNPDGSKEGVFKNARYIVRIDGDIRRDAELTVAENETNSVLIHTADSIDKAAERIAVLETDNAALLAALKAVADHSPYTH